jgi:chemotaxis protein CheX
MRTVLSTMLELEPAMTGHDAAPPPGSRTLSAIIHITGAVDGAVVLHVTEAFANLTASRMFNIPEDKVTRTDQQDALGELCNVVGGNFKSLLPEPCRLSLPTVVDGTDYSFRLPGSIRSAQYGLDVMGEPLLLRLWKRSESAADTKDNPAASAA